MSTIISSRRNGDGTTFAEAEQECRDYGWTPFRVTFATPQWGNVIGQVQSVETIGAAGLGSPRYCAQITRA